MPDPEKAINLTPTGAQPPASSEAQPVELSNTESLQAQPPLSQEQIAEMNRRRYPHFLSSEEIEHINAARARGIHHGV